MLEEFKELMQRRDLITFAVGLVMALAAFYLIEAVVVDLIAPLISVFIGSSHFELNTFTVGTSEFRYGLVIEAVIAFVLAGVVAYVVLVLPQRRHQAGKGVTAKTRVCPECASSIPAVAKRCPNCTATVQPDLA